MGSGAGGCMRMRGLLACSASAGGWQVSGPRVLDGAIPADMQPKTSNCALSHAHHHHRDPLPLCTAPNAATYPRVQPAWRPPGKAANGRRRGVSTVLGGPQVDSAPAGTPCALH